MALPLLHPPTPYTFGAMSLGSDEKRLEYHIALARSVMESGQWMHASPTYHRGFTFMVLRSAFDEAPSQRPPLIIKIRDGSPRWLRFETEDCCRRLGVEQIDIAQLVAMDRQPGNLIDQLRAGDGPLVAELAALRARGLIRQAALYCDRANSEAAAAAAIASPLVEALTMYWNASQDEATPAAWDAIRAAQLPVLALRTLGGGLGDAQRATAQHSLATTCGCTNPVELALRLAASEPSVVTTIGGSGSREHWQALSNAARKAAPLAPMLFT